jgi:uracil-DNA glycosylase
VCRKIHYLCPYERVAALDLVKCATVTSKGQRTALPRKDRDVITRKCEDYLVSQLREYRPKVVMAYGADVIDWFQGKRGKEEIGDFEAFSGSFGDYSFRGVAVPQRQGPHSVPEVKWVQKRLLALL